MRTCRQVTCVASCQDCTGCWWRLDRGWETKAKAQRLLGCCRDPTGSHQTFPPGTLLLVLLSLFPGPIPNCSEEPGGLACLPPATPTASPVFPPSLISPSCHSFALQATCHSGHPVGCCLCMFLSLPFALAQPGMFSHPLHPISVSTQLLPPLFYMHCFCPGCVACSSSHEALEGRAHILPCSRLRPPQSPPYRRASKAMGHEWHLGLLFPGHLVIWRNSCSSGAWPPGPSVLAHGPKVWDISGALA